ncbi:MAG: type VI secretion system tube protein Hcp [Pyrinomonadaceae bacterium]|nr:type VI secretion system tube protein Hcp [Pyrinomonadaceae bacterium]
MPIYMKFEGIEGEAKDKYKGWIELDSCQIGTSNPDPTARGGSREPGAPKVSEIVITKRQDNSSSGLFREAFNGTGKKVTIAFVKDGTEYLTLELENVLISNYSVSGHGGDAHDRPIESFSFNFSKITYTTKPISKDEKKNEERIQWDLATQ